MSRDPDGFPFDPDPLHVDELEPRLPIHESPRQRQDGVPGPALVLVIVGIPLLLCIAVGLLWLATR